MMNLGLGEIAAHGDMPDLALALRGTAGGVGKWSGTIRFTWAFSATSSQACPRAGTSSCRGAWDIAGTAPWPGWTSGRHQVGDRHLVLARIVGTIPPDPGSGSRTAAARAL